MEDVAVETAGGRNDHAMVGRLFILMTLDTLLPRLQGFGPFLPGARPVDIPADGDGPRFLLDRFGSLDEAYSRKGREAQWRKNHS